MRRKEKEITDRAVIDSIMKKASVCRIAMCSDNIPYIVPMNFGYDGTCIYLHSAKEGHKIDILKSNPNVCFEVDIDTELVTADTPCGWSMKFKSIIGSGKAVFLSDAQEKARALDAIMEQYSGPTGFHYADSMLERIAVIKIEIAQITGKQTVS